MIRRLFFLVLLFPLLSVADVEGFDQVKAAIQTQLDLIQQQNSSILRNAQQGLVNLVGIGSEDPGYNIAHQCRGYFSNIISGCNDQSQLISRAMQLTSTLAPTNSSSSVDYSSILQSIYWQVYDLNSRLWYDINPRLDAIISALSDLGVGDNSEILTVLGQIRTILNDDLKPLLVWMNDSGDTFRSFYSNAVERIEHLDQNVEMDLSRMWQDTLYHMSNLVRRTYDEWGHGEIDYTLYDQISNVTVGVDFRLSNEGYIQLQNLAMNQRQYLCTVEALEMMRGMTNNANADLVWITNYLNKVQQPYYAMYNNIARFAGWNNVNYFNPPHYDNITNVFDTSLPLSSMPSRFIKFTRDETNWFSRIELYLMNLNGMFGSYSLSGEDEDELNRNLDRENIERNLEYGTNTVLHLVEEYANVSNFFSQVSASFQSLLASWDIGDDSGGTGAITIMPSFQLGGIQFEHIDVSTLDFAEIGEATRLIFTAIWWLIFGLIGFRFMVITVFLLGKTIARICMLVSVFLN